jgi:hypothetical protein
VAASGAEDEENNSPAAYNASIYFMVSVPYAALGVFGFLIYRGCKRNARYIEQMRNHSAV